MKRVRLFLVHTLCVLAILSASISPACAFIGGKYGDWIEICSGLNITKIQIQNNETPDVTKQACEFCFQHFNMSAIEITTLPLNISKHSLSIRDFTSEIALIQYHQSYHSRAPPVFS